MQYGKPPHSAPLLHPACPHPRTISLTFTTRDVLPRDSLQVLLDIRQPHQEEREKHQRSTQTRPVRTRSYEGRSNVDTDMGTPVGSLRDQSSQYLYDQFRMWSTDRQVHHVPRVEHDSVGVARVAVRVHLDADGARQHLQCSTRSAARQLFSRMHASPGLSMFSYTRRDLYVCCFMPEHTTHLMHTCRSCY